MLLGMTTSHGASFGQPYFPYAKEQLMAAVHQPGFQPQGISEAVQDYAKAIYALEMRTGGEAVHTNALAERLGVTPASASGMVRRLAELRLVRHVRYKGVKLTDAGRRVA